MTKQVSAADAETASAATSPVAAVNGDAGSGTGVGAGAGGDAKAAAKKGTALKAGAAAKGGTASRTGAAAKGGTVSKNGAAPKGSTAAKNSAGSKANTRANANSNSNSAANASAGSGPAAGLSNRHATLRYTTLRLALFVAALLLVWIVAVVFNMDLTTDTSRLIMIAVALFLSSAASLVVLSKQRDEMSAGIVARTQRLGRKLNDAATFEDAEED